MLQSRDPDAIALGVLGVKESKDFVAACSPKHSSSVTPEPICAKIAESRLQPLQGRSAPMKLSEAILLGSTVVTPKAGALHFSGENAGCALGMAAIASGCTFSPAERQIPVKDLRTVNVEDIWGPWLLRVVIRPCDCRAPIKLS